MADASKSAATEPEWEERVIMFVGLADAHRHREAHGSERAIDLLRQHALVAFDALGDNCRCGNYESHIVRHSNDELMLWFPRGEAASAVRCAIDIIERLANTPQSSPDDVLIQSRAGIAYGRVVPSLHDRPQALAADPRGRPVDVAAQLVSIAQAGQILVDQHYQDMVPRGDLETPEGDPASFVPRPAAAKRIRGIREPVQVSAVVWRGHKTSITNTPVLRAELHHIEEALSDLQSELVYVLQQTRLNLETGDRDGLRQARDRLKDMAGDGRRANNRWVGALFRLRHVFQQSSEAAGHDEIREQYRRMDAAYEAACSRLKERERSLLDDDPEVRQNAVNECYELVAAFFVAAHNFQVTVNNVIRRMEVA